MTCGFQLSCGELILQLLIYGLSNGAVLALNAIGVTVVYGTVRTLNLAHGDVFALTSVFVTTLVARLGAQGNWPPALLLGTLALTLGAALLFGGLLNGAIERLAFKPFRARSTLAPLIATLGISFMLYQGALVWRTALPSWVPGDHRSVPGLPEVPIDRIPDLLPAFDLVRASHLPLNVTFQFSDLFVLALAVACALGVTWFLSRTSAGRAIRACAQDPQLAQLCGVDLERSLRQVFVFGGALAGVAAFVFALYYTRPFGYHGAQSGLLAFTAAILGGIGNPLGALLSALMLGVAAAFSDYFLAAQWTPVLMQALLVGLLVLRPTGLTAEDQASDPAGREALIGTGTGRRLPADRRLIWLFAGLALLFPMLDILLGLQKLVILTGIGIFILLALGLNVQLGLAGVLDLGYTVSFGLGGYLTALLTSRGRGFGGWLPQPLEFGVALALSVLLAGLFGALKGRLAGRLRSDYLAVVTLALGLMARQIIINLNDLTGGTGGLAALPPPRLLTYAVTHPTAQYLLVFALVIVAALMSQRLIASPLGRAWRAGNEDELAAASCGVDVARSKTLALSLSAAMAGAAGALYASLFAYVAPEMMGFHLSAMTLAMVILGGAGSVPGAVLGALVIVGYDRLLIPGLGEFLAQFQPTNVRFGSAPDVRGLSYFAFGLALYLTVLIRARRR